uniref:chitin synthase n=1 Tax=Plectus sambesii TaxID=2011161 RepID=A0A914VNP4_9BILA
MTDPPPLSSYVMNSTLLSTTAAVIGGGGDGDPPRGLTKIGSGGRTRSRSSNSTGGLSLPEKRRRKKSKEPISMISDRIGIDRRWDVFRSVPRDQDAFEPRWTKLAAQGLKLVMYVILHGLVLTSGLIAKLLVLLMAANLRNESTYIPCKPLGFQNAYIAQAPEPKPEFASTWFYWGLWLAMCVPQLLILLRSARVVVFKGVPNPSIYLFCASFIVESLKTVGQCLLVFFILPELDSVRGAMLLGAVAVIPCFLSLLASVYTAVVERHRISVAIADVLALLGQLSALCLWWILDADLPNPILMVCALVLCSLSWWENYVTKTSDFRPIRFLGKIKDRMARSRYKLSMVFSLWNCFLSWFIMLLAAGDAHDIQTLFQFSAPFGNATTMSDEEIVWNDHSRHTIWMFVLVALCSWVCYTASKFACKVRMDWFSYAVPTIIILPAVVLFLFAFCEARRVNPCFLAGVIPDTAFWRCDDGVSNHYVWAFGIWFLSYAWTAHHIFTQKSGRLSKTDTLFVTPMYDGLMVDQSLALNRRRVHAKRIKTQALREHDEMTAQGRLPDDDFDGASLAGDSEHSVALSTTSLSMFNREVDQLTKIYICATLWHETPTEMVQMLKSIVRMDEDQSARRNAQKYLKVVDPDYYEMEAHVFFDDAWEDDDKLGRVPNMFVHQLFMLVSEAVRDVHKTTVELRPPLKVDTAYGGRIVFTLPGDNRLFVHLKDKKKVRNKKRWSQVMYMYYLLGHRIMDVITDTARKQVLADNTYILAIDGDSKFEPSAVQKLVDLMKKHSSLGSACGRIHPIGRGVMVWYQKFEYAIAHWFQKAAEHVFGCVLCAPGCFSLFRASALMDDNVMHKYTKTPVEPHHFVQYDQGEDRWLSTLLLKQGYRIEYAAAADAETYAPEGFDEFYNQRRRWTPSSIANTIDLLADFKRASANNDSISRLYILYQMMVIMFSLIGPAIIFTMLVFAQTAAFGVDSQTMLIYNIIPVVTFALLCFIAGSKAQLLFAKFASVVYAFIMMAVVVATGIQIVIETFLSPTSMFVLSMVLIFSTAAFLHPREFPNIIYGAIFFLMIPCTYVFMALYSLINLNVINWGTREAAAKAAGKNINETIVQRWMKRIFPKRKKAADAENGESETVDWDCSHLCPCLCRPQQTSLTEQQFVWVGQQLERIDRKMDMQMAGARRMPLNVLSDPEFVQETPKQPFNRLVRNGAGQLTADGGGNEAMPKLLLTDATPPSGNRTTASPTIDTTPSLENKRRIYRTVSESAVNELAEMQTGALSSGELSDASDGDSISSFGSSGDLLDARARNRRR